VAAPVSGKKTPGKRGLGGFNTAFFAAPQMIFFVYLFACAAVTFAYRFFFPVLRAPLALYSFKWKFILWTLEFIDLFPALAMSALMIPFNRLNEKFEGDRRFNMDFLFGIRLSILTAVIAAVLYGLLFLVAMPVAGKEQENIISRSELYADSRAKAVAYTGTGDWANAFRFATICEQIWPDNPDVSNLRNTIDAEFYHLEYLQDRAAPAWHSADSDPQEREPVDAAGALRFGEAAFAEERYYDAHWLATLAGRLAKRGSVEESDSARLAGRSWNAIESLSPGGREQEQGRIYRLKRSGYEAMAGQDWIKGYYIFKELIELSPDDPDAADFLRRCERETLQIAFFSDELDLTVGNVLSEAVFSLPHSSGAGEPGGRLVLRIDALSAFLDCSYGFDVEMAVIDGAGFPVNRLEALYTKFLPKTVNGKARVAMLLLTLDRRDPDLRQGPVWAGPGEVDLGGVEFLLDLSYENFLLITRVRGGIEHLPITDLFAAEQNLAPYGYIREVFLAQAINRIAEPLFLLPLFITSLIIAWRFRPKRQPRYLAIPMLAIMPVVFRACIAVYRSLIEALGIGMALVLSFSASMVVLGAAVMLLFFLSLFFLVFQRS
jgi:hypothetical protein